MPPVWRALQGRVLRRPLLGEGIMKIYLSGPIKGHEETYRQRFADAAAALRGMGHHVVSPVEQGDILEQKLGRTPTYEEYMQDDVRCLLICDAIYMLQGWERSAGARCEFHVAALCGIEVMYE